MNPRLPLEGTDDLLEDKEDPLVAPADTYEAIKIRNHLPTFQLKPNNEVTLIPDISYGVYLGLSERIDLSEPGKNPFASIKIQGTTVEGKLRGEVRMESTPPGASSSLQVGSHQTVGRAGAPALFDIKIEERDDNRFGIEIKQLNSTELRNVNAKWKV